MTLSRPRKIEEKPSQFIHHMALTCRQLKEPRIAQPGRSTWRTRGRDPGQRTESRRKNFMLWLTTVWIRC